MVLPIESWQNEPLRYEFLGAKFDPFSQKETLRRVEYITASDSFRYLVTPNVDHMVRLNRDPALYKPLYDAAWISVCDSRILELLAGISGIHLKAVPGSDLTALVLQNVLNSGETINVVGADAATIETLRGKFPNLNINHHEPPMGLRHKPEAVDKAAQFVADHPARYTFLCVGSPQQEMVAQACQARGDCKGLGLCVGASLDFLTGKARRAPLWMQKSRLEWLFRLLSEPRRLWRRYLIEGPKIFSIWAGWALVGRGR